MNYHNIRTSVKQVKANREVWLFSELKRKIDEYEVEKEYLENKTLNAIRITTDRVLQRQLLKKSQNEQMIIDNSISLLNRGKSHLKKEEYIAILQLLDNKYIESYGDLNKWNIDDIWLIYRLIMHDK